MTVYRGHQSTERKVARVWIGAKEFSQRPYTGRWNTPDVDDDPPVPPLETGFQQPADAGIEDFAYRLHMDGTPEFRGHVQIDGATSPALVFVFPAGGQVGFEAQPSYRIGEKQQYKPTAVIDTDGVTAVPGIWLYDGDNGELSLIWPYP